MNSTNTGWRLTREKYADLSGEGARRKGGRWNSRGKAMVYLSAEASLPLLEILVHLDVPPDLLPQDYVLMRVDLEPLAKSNPDIWLEVGPTDVLEDKASKDFGDQWLEEERSPLLQVPSVIVQEANNLLLNPAHPAVTALAKPILRPFDFDHRLFNS
ncbi:RES family NAD+ phosphorylase [Aestuariispira ectoiniformans]|uniref:RES family NAD+ phosphorylase n=1 Tax=Aestuariispira ectoiniformans TaxID=2775080 RepID=UPI00223AA2E7|nr:RES family NAD+ phosphorylase [Aestuariispira ectoiniformans]